MKQIATVRMDNSDVVAGNVRLKVGDVIKHDGGYCIVSKVNESGAQIIPLSSSTVTIKPTFGEEATFEKRNTRTITITNQLPRESILERSGEQGLQDFLDAGKSGRDQDNQNKTGNEKENNTMANKTLAKGGLVADAIRSKSGKGKTAKTAKAKEEGGSRGALGELFGHSVTGVIRTMAVKFPNMVKEQIVTALAAKGLKPAAPTVQIQMSRGRTGKLPTVALTGAQLDELKKLAGPAPVAEAKPAKAAKGKKVVKVAKATKTKKTAKAPAAPVTEAAPATTEAPATQEAPATETAPEAAAA
jgi:hypothetical protein